MSKTNAQGSTRILLGGYELAEPHPWQYRLSDASLCRVVQVELEQLRQLLNLRDESGDHLGR